ncbi:serine hydrolase [Nakamurella sp. YIM 132087]|uniref:Serine hydrolase n=1 Tax=Nakamurella alba TaxID=2665158 RepID=A0A7K1FLU8_9ACTN|nr:serine hydrolase domain-containing protein [Nakamurella alba]MTD15122.1 serine hydrolase [Nakamurella alba]
MNPRDLARRTRAPLSLLVAAALLAGCTSTTESETSTGTAAPDASTSAAPTSNTAAPSGATTSGATTTEPAYVATLRPQIEEALAKNGVPGAVVLVRDEAQGDWTEAFGTRTVGGGEAVTTDDVFRLADITATMTASILLKLEEQGKLSLQDPISDYVDGVPGGDELTLQELGEYRSGLFSYDQDAGFRKTATADPTKVWTPQELLDISFAHPVQTGPAGFLYSNTDYILLGLVIEKVTGQDAATAFRTMLFDPLELDENAIGLSGTTDDLPSPHPDGYAFETPADNRVLPTEQREAAAAGELLPVDRSDLDPSYAWTAGAGYASASALADYFTAVVDGPLIDQAQRLEWNKDIADDGVTTADSVRYGFGMATQGDFHLYGGAMPGFNSFAAHSPSRGTTVVVLTNLSWTPAGGSPVAPIFSAITDSLNASSPTASTPSAAPTSEAPTSAAPTAPAPTSESSSTEGTR